MGGGWVEHSPRGIVLLAQRCLSLAFDLLHHFLCETLAKRARVFKCPPSKRTWTLTHSSVCTLYIMHRLPFWLNIEFGDFLPALLLPVLALGALVGFPEA